MAGRPATSFRASWTIAARPSSLRCIRSRISARLARRCSRETLEEPVRATAIFWRYGRTRTRIFRRSKRRTSSISDFGIEDGVEASGAGDGDLSSYLRRAASRRAAVSRARAAESHASADGARQRGLAPAAERAWGAVAGTNAWPGAGRAGDAQAAGRLRPPSETPEARWRRAQSRPRRSAGGGVDRRRTDRRPPDARDRADPSRSRRSARRPGGRAPVLLRVVVARGRGAARRLASDGRERLDACSRLAAARADRTPRVSFIVTCHKSRCASPNR